MFKFLRKTFLWILLLPYVVGYTGAALNQAVLIANHDTFPVNANARILKDNPNFKPDEFGIIDDAGHCVMTSKTHLNFLADIIDLRSAYVSVGDILLMLGEKMGDPSVFVWVTLVAYSLYKKE